MANLSATASSEPSGEPTGPRRLEHAGVSGWVDLILPTALALFALAVRWPHLWTVPRFTDETLEVLHSLSIVRDGARPLTNYDSYYGALYNYLVAGALWLGGQSPLVPRVVILTTGALTVAATYLLGRALATRLWPVGGGLWSALAPRAAGALAALFLATNGAHVVVNSHIAWSHCLTPLLTTLGFWLLRRVDPSPQPPPRRGEGEMLGGRGACLAAAGFVFGLALQTHPLVAALLPGAAVYVLWRGRALWRTPWPYAGLLFFLIGYGNVLLYNWQTGFESLTSGQRIRTEYGRDQDATVGYGPTLVTMLLLLARVLGGAVDQRASWLQYVFDPLLLLASLLCIVALVWLARRGEPLPLLLALSFLLLLPVLNPKFRTLLSSRYLMPLVPLLFAVTAVFLVHSTRVLLAGRLGVPTLQRQKGVLALGAPIAAVLLVIAPVAPLGRYYARTFERSDTNERILRLSAEIADSRRPGEVVLVDEAMGTEQPDTGVTELRGMEYLLVFQQVPHRVTRAPSSRLQEELRGTPSALAILNARDATLAADRLSVTPLDMRPPVESGRMADYRLYRVAPRTSSQPSGADS